MEKKDLHIRYWLISLTLFALFFITLFFSLRGRIEENFLTGGYREEAISYMEEKTRTVSETCRVAFWGKDGIRITKKTVEKGIGDEMHLLVEALLEGPDEAELKSGMITYIPKGTKLIGLTRKNELCFVSVSDKIYESPDLDKAVEQIKNTLTSEYPELRVAVLVKDEIIS